MSQIGLLKYKDCEIILLDISRHFRGQGWGSKLLSQAEDQLRQQGCQEVRVKPGRLSPIDPDPTPFYLKNGYRHQESWWLRTLGLSPIHLVKKLTP